MDTLEVLTKARELISEPERWTRGTFSRGADGRRCSLSLEPPVCWCAAGAIDWISGNGGAARAAKDALCRELGGGIGPFNDTHTHAEVLAAFDRAIETARQTQGAGQ